MIISASRRTDIPAHYAQWFLNRVREGFVLVRNPRAPHQVGRVSIAPENVDGIVFWTKNPAPLLARLPELSTYSYYFQCTLTAYGADVEPGVPSKARAIVPAVARLSDAIGAEKVIWRYDPILLTEKYTIAYHLRYFEALAQRLEGRVKRCTISFLDEYPSIRGRLRDLRALPCPDDEKLRVARALREIADAHAITLDACAEPIDLSGAGVARARCVDPARFGLARARKDPNQRSECGCAASVDIGLYDTCLHGCAYCYANHSAALLERNRLAHDPFSPLLSGALTEKDVVRDRKI